jgi:hypothetical protein
MKKEEITTNNTNSSNNTNEDMNKENSSKYSFVIIRAIRGKILPQPPISKWGTGN